MTLSPVRRHTNERSGPRQHVETRLYGRSLLLARAVWIVLVVFTIGLLVIGIAVYYPQLGLSNELLQGGTLYLDPSSNGYLAFTAYLDSFLGGYTALSIVFSSIASLFWILVGCVIFWRKSDDWMALFVALTLVLFGVYICPPLFIIYIHVGIHSPWRLLITLENLLAFGCMGFIFCFFPSGRSDPRWIRWFSVLCLMYQVPFIVPLNSTFSYKQWPPLLFAVLEVSFTLVLLFAQLYRYRYISSPIQRQQTRWVVFGLAITMVAYIALLAPAVFVPVLSQPGLPRQLHTLISLALLPFTLLALPLTIGIAMVYSRLWDIDVLINRTLVYGMLTVVLVLVYFAGVVLLQQLFQAVTGQASALAITGSTLGIVVIFQPLRSRLQTIIDRRFYRRKYDAARVLAAFGERLQHREDVDLKTLSDDLLAVIQATMEPAHVSLWLCQPASQETADEETLSKRTAVITRLLKDTIREEAT